jgi:hypothetical protein
VGDVVDPPGRRAEHEAIADLALEHHLLVELAEPTAPGWGVDQVHPIEAAIGDRPARRDRDPVRAVARAHHAGRAVVGQARADLGQLLEGVAAGQHLDRGVEHRPRQLGEVAGPPHQRVGVVDAPRLERRHRHQLLRQDVEGVS